MTIQALIFDVDGTLAETEEMHRWAFNRIFRDQGLDWHWDKSLYADLLAVAGGRERIHHYILHYQPKFNARPNLDSWVMDLQERKTRLYAEGLSEGRICLRPGVARLIHQAVESGMRMAIATTTSLSNVRALFTATLGLDVLDQFEVIGAGEQAQKKKPDPAIYHWVLQQLDLPATQCLALEDSSNGLRAAAGADIPVLITPALYTREEDFSAARWVMTDLGEPDRHHQVLRGDLETPGWIDLSVLTRA